MQWYLKVVVLGGVYIMNAINALFQKKKNTESSLNPSASWKYSKRMAIHVPGNRLAPWPWTSQSVGYKLLWCFTLAA